MKSKPLISIVMPVYNGGDYFAQALKSATEQTWENFEIIVVDDGSFDGGASERHARGAGSKVKYVYQDNTGVAGALNRGIEEMQGDIFCWLSHDDMFLPDKIEKQVAFHQKLGLSEAILFSDYNLIDEGGRRTGTIRADREKLRRAPQLALLNGCINGCTIYAPANIMREFGGFELKYRYTQDYRLWNKIIKKYEFFHQPDVLIDYRVHSSQGSNAPNAVAEGEELWIAMIDDRSEFERVQIFGSSYLYYHKLAEHLRASPYRMAQMHAEEMAAHAVDRTVVSVILSDAPQVDELAALIADFDRAHPSVEVIHPDTSGQPIVARRPGGVSNNVSLSARITTRGDYLDAATSLASGAYVVFARGKTVHSGRRIRNALVTAQQMGAVLGLMTVGVGQAIKPVELLTETVPANVVEKRNWFIHKSKLMEAPQFDSELAAFGDGAMLSALSGDEPIPGLYNPALDR